MMCLMCDAVVDDFWRWCPECGGEVVDCRRLARRRMEGGVYSVEWTIDEEEPSQPEPSVA